MEIVERDTEVNLLAEEVRSATSVHEILGLRLHVFPSVNKAAGEALSLAQDSDRGFVVFTCNVDHVMLMKKSPDFRKAYGNADLITIDGAPLALLLKWMGTRLVSRVTGVDLVEALLAHANTARLKVALVGGLPERAQEAACLVQHRYSSIGGILTDSPKMGFVIGDEEDLRLMQRLQSFSPDIIVVCLGAPRQELWIEAHADDFKRTLLIGAGATVDFLSGRVSRAPRAFQRTGTEAFYRLATDFRRLWRRYLLRDTRFILTMITSLARHHSRVLYFRNTHPRRTLSSTKGMDTREGQSPCN